MTVLPMLCMALMPLTGCNRHAGAAPVAGQEVVRQRTPEPAAEARAGAEAAGGTAAGGEPERHPYIGFDRNVYPGDATLAGLHEHFAYAGFWLNRPPGEQQNTWAGHRKQLVDAGFGFAVLYNGRLDAEIKHATIAPDALGRQDAGAAMAAARREGFPEGTIVFLDQEEGGRLLPEQASYFFGFTEALAAGAYRAGAYVSGQPSDDGAGADGKRATITTARDVSETVRARQLHPVALWVAEDACPPAPGCSVDAEKVSGLRPRDSGTLDAVMWQYAQSPERPELTKACAATYAADGNCHAGAPADLYVDLNLSSSADPSRGR